MKTSHESKLDSELDTQRQTTVVKPLKEKSRKYNISFCIAFVDLEKAFDTMQTQAILILLQDQGIEDMYMELLDKIYTNSSMTVRLYKESNKINIRRGVRQGDNISPKLFTAALDSKFRRLTWGTRGLKIDGEYLRHLCLADDILICANAPDVLQHML